MPPVPTSFDVLAHGNGYVLYVSFKTTALRIRQQRTGYRWLQSLAKGSQHFPGAIAGIVTTAQFGP